MMKASMKTSLQHLLCYIPLHQLQFFTSIPRKLVLYETIYGHIPENWLESPTLCVLQNEEDIQQLNKLEIASRMIQDHHLAGIIICAKDSVVFQSEPLLLFQQCGLPVIQVYNMEAVQLFSREEEELYCFWQLNTELNGFIEKGFTRMAEELSEILRTPLLYCDEQYRVLWETGNEEDLREARRWINVHHRELLIKESATANEGLDLPGRDGGFSQIKSFRPYSINLPRRACQWILVSNELVSWQRQIMGKFAGLTSLYFQNEHQTADIMEKVKRYFVYELLYHKFESQKVMIEQGKIWGWNLERPHHILLVDIELSDDWKGDSLWQAEMIDFIDQEKRKLRETVHVVPFEDQIILLLEDDEVRTSENRKRYAVQLGELLEQDLSRKWKECTFHVGIGKWYQDTTFLNKSYQEARLALKFGQGWFREQKVFHFNDLGVLRLLMHVHQGILSDFSQDYLSVLMDSDRESGTEYMKTLQSYVQFRGRIDEVAEALFIHPNTLRNRIKKIEEMLGIDLQDSEEFSNIMIAVKIYFFLNS
nr:PucR family transcriptional regulator [uncultured Bacillus sp.]